MNGHNGNSVHREGPGFIPAQPFRALSRKRLSAIRNALKALEDAQQRKDGPRASKYAERLCELAMNAEGHFWNMRRRACTYVEI